MNSPVQTKEEILGILESKEEAMRKFGVKRIGVFGSFVREDQSPASDVDILVEFQPTEKSFQNFMDLLSLLEGLLQREVELVTLERLSPYLKPYILNEVLYAEATS